MSTAAAQLRSSPEKTNGAKLSRLLIDGGKSALQGVFDAIHPPATLQTILNTHCTTLLPLLNKKRVLNKTQWDLLYPPSGAPPDSSTFDITLLSVLLRNICGLHPPALGWDKKPPPTDQSREADLARIKLFRNELYGHVATTGIDARSFSVHWVELSDTLVRLGLDESEIFRLKSSPLEEERYLNLMTQWKVQDEEIKEQLEEVKSMLHQVLTPTEEIARGSILYWENTDNLLGEGSLGTRVYKGKLRSTGELVAVKRMHKTGTEKREADKLKKLEHPNIIKCFAVEECKVFVYLALELCKKTLMDCLKQNDFRRTDGGAERLKCLKEITGAVSYLHERNICHRDIKPDNILLSLSTPQRFVLADFNIAKSVHSASTSVGNPAGTMGYIAPELRDIEARMTTKADLFSLGCVFFNVLSNMCHPFGPMADLKRCQISIYKGQKPILKKSAFLEEDTWIKPIISRMLCRDPVERPNATDVMKDLELYRSPILVSRSEKIRCQWNLPERPPLNPIPKETTRSAEAKAFTAKTGSKVTSSFEVQFQEFTSYITHFEGCLKESQALLKTLKEAFQCEDAGKKEGSRVFMTEKEEKQLSAYVQKTSTVLVVGQTNSGKSSFLNELLGGSYLPTAEVPCTSRIVRLKYSEHNYMQLFDKDGQRKCEATTFTRKSIPKTEIVLRDTEGSSEEWVNQVMEVGIKNSLLHHGHLEFVDAPSMSENETFVRECLDGVLQVVIYVIDGNPSLRTQEVEFLYKLKEKIGHLPIFFVCNKVDRNQEAEDFDRDSDDEEEELEEAVRRVIQEKTQLSYTSLVKNGLLNEDAKPEDCDGYHGVSTKEVRKARREGVTNQYTEGFEKMKSKLLKFAASSIKSHLRSAAEQLCQVQQRMFHFALSRGLKRDDPRSVETILGELKSKEWDYNSKISTYIQDKETIIARLVSAEVRNSTERILEAAELMEFSPIKTSDAIGRNEVVRQCRTQIQTLVQMQVIHIAQRKVKGTIMTIMSNAKTSLEKSFAELSKESDRIGKFVKRELLKCFPLSCSTPNDHLLQFDSSMMTSVNSYIVQAYNVVRNLTSIVTGTTINKEWKRKIAKDVINSIDYGEVTKRILQSLRQDLDGDHGMFLVNVQLIQAMCDEVRKQTADQRKVFVSQSPSFAEQMCKTEALLETLSSSRVQLGTEVGKGNSGVVYNCTVHGMGKVVAKQLYVNGIKNDQISIFGSSVCHEENQRRS